MIERLRLRDVQDEDLGEFFAHEQDPIAQQMAAFIGDDPSDRDAFDTHWANIRANETIVSQTILVDDKVAGHIAKFNRGEEPEVTYWLGREWWGQGVATAALTAFLEQIPVRPIYARAAKDNVASIRVLEKCGFTIARNERGFANARGEEIDEVVMVRA